MALKFKDEILEGDVNVKNARYDCAWHHMSPDKYHDIAIPRTGKGDLVFRGKLINKCHEGAFFLYETDKNQYVFLMRDYDYALIFNDRKEVKDFLRNGIVSYYLYYPYQKVKNFKHSLICNGFDLSK